MKKIVLPDVTLLSATSVDIDSTLRALAISSREIDFCAIKLLAPSAPPRMPAEFEFVAIPQMSLLGYSRFILKDLFHYVDSPYCLIVQADGFVVNADNWRSEFLKYDYIGAPWPEKVWVYPDNYFLPLRKNRVGNGGFSLRSHKLMELTANIDFDGLNLPIKSEDMIICHYMYEEMLEKGIQFAPPEVAAKFSIESQEGLYGQNINSVFGFHGKHYLAEMLTKVDHDLLRKVRMFPAITKTDKPLKVGRNELCPCGSGKKYKLCHGRSN